MRHVFRIRFWARLRQVDGACLERVSPIPKLETAFLGVSGRSLGPCKLEVYRESSRNAA